MFNVILKSKKHTGRMLTNFVPRANVCRGKHMDDLPIPCGDWLESHRNRNSFYNIVLATGASYFLIAITVLATNIEFNYSPPPNYDL